MPRQPVKVPPLVKAEPVAAIQRQAPDLRARLLAWYDRHRRELPWRAGPGGRSDPYRVWLSEIMLQQTTVAAVAPYYRGFLARWPQVEALAAADLDDVLTAWAGLGYYARARNLHRCARVVAVEHGGRFPETEEELRRLPGIGPYTAAAIAAIAFDQPAAAVDGNVERVLARLCAIRTPLPQAKPEIAEVARALVPSVRAGDHTQALFDLGATVCTPRKPRCLVCPWGEACQARRLDIAEALPAKAAKADKPTRRGTAFLLLDGEDRVLLRRRAERGLLGGMLEVPSTPWTTLPPDADAVAAAAPAVVAWRALPGEVRHTFTHFHLHLTVMLGHLRQASHFGDGQWVAIDRLGEVAVPAVMAKVIRHGLAAADREAV